LRQVPGHGHRVAFRHRLNHAEQPGPNGISSDMARRVTTVVVALNAALAASTSAVSAQLTSDIILRGLNNPVALVADPSDTSVLLIAEQDGLIRVARDGTVGDEPFLDLRDAISTGGERGLLGLALAPDYAESGRVFVNFTNRDGHTVIARFTRHPDEPYTLDPASRVDLEWPDGRRHIEQPFSNHNGGHLAFGPDGYLYAGLGDGGSGGDPLNLAQNTASLLGKMLRLDVRVPDDDQRGYRVPDDNPFVGATPLPALAEIWALGLRNPWRYSFDDATRGGTSALVIADVGQNAREEINFEPAGRGGRNYGWRLREGRLPFDTRTPAAQLPLTDPIHDYGRSQGGSITGGLVYRGAALDPGFHGRYFYADFVSGRVFSIGLHLDAAGEAMADDEREHTSSLGARDTLGMPSTFGQDQNGEMLLANYSAGTVVRIVPDFSVVPMAPTVAAVPDGQRVALTWSRPGGAVAVGYVVERVQHGAVVERQGLERTDVVLDWAPGECLRVRAEARNGWSGPASASICRADSPPSPAGPRAPHQPYLPYQPYLP
jgi:glucose/arabinose dehydrogenase